MSGKKLKQLQLIFGGGLATLNDTLDDIKLDEQLEALDNDREQFTGVKRSSAYVLAFEDMVDTVLQHEPDLLSFDEIAVLNTFPRLCYNTRYCLVKLLLRKANQWHPISALKSYEKEVSAEGLQRAIQDLCRPLLEISGGIVNTEDIDTRGESAIVKTEDSIIDLSLSGDEDVKANITESRTLPLARDSQNSAWLKRAESSRLDDPIQAVLQTDPTVADISFFCEDESAMSTNEILGRLNKDQLVAMAKEMKCKLQPGAKKEDVISCLERQASGQQVLNFSASFVKGKGKARDNGLRQANLTKFACTPTPKQTQEQRLRDMALKRLGSCIRVNYDFYRLVRRLHLICFRSVEHPIDLLQPALLSIFKKRQYPMYAFKRTSDVWTSREELLEYEQALELTSLLEEIIDDQTESVPRRSTKTPAPQRSVTVPATPGDKKYSTPLKTPGSIGNLPPGTPLPTWDDVSSTGFDNLPGEVEVTKLTKHEKLKQHFIDWIQPRWVDYVLQETERGVTQRAIGLERFDAGYVYTRMIYKAASSFGPLKEYELELHTLDDLLKQRLWRRGKRGEWYTRRALVLNHLAQAENDPTKKRNLHYRSLEGLKDALLDDDTGIVYRPGLVIRLQKLEKTLKVPLAERSQCDGELRKPPEEFIRAERAEPLKLDKYGRPIGEKENTPNLLSIFGLGTSAGKATEAVKRTGKSIWKGRGGELVDVETRALEFYEDKGYQGFHCETRILTTLFGLLFWDIIYAGIPGAFDTQYQVSPLDMLHDSFYRARKRIADERFEELRQGKAAEILRRHDDSYRERAVLGVGVRWDLCSREDLLEIIECFNGETLAIICQIFCEDYRGRSSGGPDLFIWNAKERRCKFVEVKGPGDRPQENQKFWFDSLQRAGADVEICWVIDINNPKSAGKRKRASSGRRKSAPPKVEDPESEQEDYDQLDGHEKEDEMTKDTPRNKKRRIANQPDHGSS